MLISNGDGTFIGGPLDVLCILHNVKMDTYHAAFFEEAPFPGPIRAPVVRLRCKMSHTIGAKSFTFAQRDLDELRAKIVVHAENVWRDKAEPWDGELGPTMVRTNWRTESTHGI